VTEVVAEPPIDDAARLSRATIGMTAGTLLSRVTGFGRVATASFFSSTIYPSRKEKPSTKL